MRVLELEAAAPDELVQAIVGVAAVLGACRSIFLRFHGGRGVASAIGAMLVISPLAVLISAPVFVGVIWLSRYVSLGSLLGSAAAAIAAALLVVTGVYAPAAFVYGDLRRVHRTGLIACVYRAAEWRHKEIELAAHELLQYLDARSG